jgi:hypothetical protein
MSNPNPLPFKKTGADANPNGRPKREWTWTGLIEDAMQKLGPDKKAVKEAVVASLVAKALEGDVVAIKEIGNRLDGMPQQAIDLTTKGKPLLNFDLHGHNKPILPDELAAQADGGDEDPTRPEV